MQGARAGSVDSNHNGRLLPMPADKNGGQVEHLKAQCGTSVSSIISCSADIVALLACLSIPVPVCSYPYPFPL